jgi:hypothetical protein
VNFSKCDIEIGLKNRKNDVMRITVLARVLVGRLTFLLPRWRIWRCSYIEQPYIASYFLIGKKVGKAFVALLR